MTILEILDRGSDGRDGGPASAWFSELEKSLRLEKMRWLSEVSETDWLSDDRSWVLLSWIEDAATHVVRTKSESALSVAIFGMALLMKSSLDRRDIDLVGALLRRAAFLAGLRYEDSVAEGCRWAGHLGEAAFTILMRVDPVTPSTHTELGNGGSFTFVRSAPDFDVADLARWLEGESE